MIRLCLTTAIFLAALPATAPFIAAAEVESLGRLDFPNSGAPEAQDAFIRGVLLLHSFEFDDAAEAFREAQQIDPGFALAYWGEAMSFNHPLWRQQDRDAALAVLQRLGARGGERAARAGSEREKGYLAAVEVLYGEGSKIRRDEAYSEAMEALSRAYPNDLEAKAFYALSILGTTQGERDFATYMRAGAIAEEVFAVNPRHPGAVHYLIHSYDDPVHAPLGLRAARVYADIAPAAPHAQHMISHIFVALGRWADSIDANVKSFEVSVERVERKGLDVDQRNYHALHWLQYSRLQLGQFEAARQLMDEMNGYASESGSERARWYQAAFRAGWAVETEATELGPGPDPSATAFHASVQERFALGYMALTRSDLEVVEAQAEAIAELRAATPVMETGEESFAVFETDLKIAEVLEKELRAGAALTRGDEVAALEMMGQATVIESDLPLEFGPPQIVKPSHELLGEMLLGLERPAEAQQAFEEALERAPRRRQALEGLATAARAADDVRVAARACSELAAIYAHSDEGVGRTAACGT
jgi:tetratricopeptide (TPR) repeat protein